MAAVKYLLQTKRIKVEEHHAASSSSEEDKEIEKPSLSVSYKSTGSAVRCFFVTPFPTSLKKIICAGYCFVLVSNMLAFFYLICYGNLHISLVKYSHMVIGEAVSLIFTYTCVCTLIHLFLN